jgi:hypothetical protein
MGSLFERPPVTARVALPGAPVLDSWTAAGHPDQVRLRSYLDDVMTRIGPAGDHLSIELVVGLPATTAVDRGGRDLDNYLLPVARRVGHERIAAVFGRKLHQAASTVAVAEAVPRAGPADRPAFGVRTTASAQSVRWKQQIYQACRRAVPRPPPPGPLAVRISFAVARRRNWAALWKPAIDSLGPLLGERNPHRAFHPADDRIVDLELHRTLDDSLADDVELAFWWRPDPRS